MFHRMTGGRALLAGLAFLCWSVMPVVAACPGAGARLIVEGDGTVIDTESGLMWKRCVQGKSGAHCSEGKAETFRWVEALNEARSEAFARFDGWRLPKIEELQSLVESCLAGPAIDPIAFPNAAATEIWSASANLDYATDAMALDFAAGEPVVGSRDDAKQVRLVRIRP